MSSARSDAIAVAGYGLPGSQVAFPARPLPPPLWSSFLPVLVQEGLTGLMLDAMLNGEFPATPAQAGDVADAHDASMGVVLSLERLLIQAAMTLESAHVPYRILKGPANAHLLYPDPTLRSFADIDLLVPGEPLLDAVAPLNRAGFRPLARPGGRADQLFGRGEVLIQANKPTLQLDLHRTLAPGPFGSTIKVTELFSSFVPLPLAGHTLPALGTEERFLHACYDSALGGAHPLRSLRDVVQFVLGSGLDESKARTIAAAWSAEAVMARGVSLAWRLFDMADVTKLSAWAVRYVPTRPERRALDAYAERPRRSDQRLPGRPTQRRLAHKAAELLRRSDRGTGSDVQVGRWRDGAVPYLAASEERDE